MRAETRLGWYLLSTVIVLAIPASGRPHQDATLPFETIATQAATARDAGRLEDALALYRRGLELRPDWDEGSWHVATILYELDRPGDARDAFTEVLRRLPGHAGALGLRGLCEFQLGRYESALDDLLQARRLGVSRSPGIATPVRYHTAILLTRAGEFEAATLILTELALEGVDTPQVAEAFGINVLRMPLLPSEVSPADRERVLVAGRAGHVLARGNAAAAAVALDELVSRYPTAPHVHYARGVLRLTDDADRAIEDFRRELEISPSHVPARLQIAFEMLKRGDAAAARQPAEEAARLAPAHFATRLALGQVLLESGDLEGALREVEQAAALAPGSPQVHFVLARVYTRLGRAADAERARAEFTRLQQLVRASRHGQQSVGGIPAADVVDAPQ